MEHQNPVPKVNAGAEGEGEGDGKCPHCQGGDGSSSYCADCVEWARKQLEQDEYE